MVLQRHIDNLKERPHHQRRAVALIIAMGVIVVLFFGWVFIFFTNLHASNNAAAKAQSAQPNATATISTQQ
jgi:flagellar basal body-associated protein FliL